MCPMFQEILIKSTPSPSVDEQWNWGSESKESHSKSHSQSAAELCQRSLSLPQTLLFFPPHQVCFLSKRVSYLLAFSVHSFQIAFVSFLAGWLTGSKLNSYWSTADLAREEGQEHQEMISSSPVPKLKKELYLKAQDGWKRNWEVMWCSPPSPTQGTAQLPGTCDVLCFGCHRAENIQRVLRMVLSGYFPS